LVAQPLLAVPFPLPAGNIGPSFALPLSYWPAVVDQVGFESTHYMITKEFCGAPWPSKVLKGKKRNS